MGCVPLCVCWWSQPWGGTPCQCCWGQRVVLFAGIFRPNTLTPAALAGRLSHRPNDRCREGGKHEEEGGGDRVWNTWRVFGMPLMILSCFCHTGMQAATHQWCWGRRLAACGSS
jgi:hypothetical protein